MQRENIQSGRKRTRGLKARMGCECCISRRGPDRPDLSSGDIPAGEVRGGSHSAGRSRISKKAGTQQGGPLQE